MGRHMERSGCSWATRRAHGLALGLLCFFRRISISVSNVSSVFETSKGVNERDKKSGTSLRSRDGCVNSCLLPPGPDDGRRKLDWQTSAVGYCMNIESL